MNLMTIDEAKCKRDGICAAECPLNLIKKPDDGRPPEARDNAEAVCIRCGHCVAVCPHGALSLAGMRPEDCSPAAPELRPDAARVEYLLRSRRSARVFKDTPLGRETVARLIDIARYAPSAHNNQLAEWLVVYDKDDVQRYAALVIDWARDFVEKQPETDAARQLDLLVTAWKRRKDRVCRNAPHVVVVHAPEANPMAPATCTIAMTYLELAAAALGVGACWAGYFRRAAVEWAPLKEALGIPKDHSAFGAMLLGPALYRYYRIPLRKEAAVIWK